MTSPSYYSGQWYLTFINSVMHTSVIWNCHNWKCCNVNKSAHELRTIVAVNYLPMQPSGSTHCRIISCTYSTMAPCNFSAFGDM